MIVTLTEQYNSYYFGTDFTSYYLQKQIANYTDGNIYVSKCIKFVIPITKGKNCIN